MTGDRASDRWVAGRLAVVRALVRVPTAALPLVIAATHGASSATDAFFLVYAGILFASTPFMVAETAIVPFVAPNRPPQEREHLVAAVLVRSTAILCPLTLTIAAAAFVWRAAGTAPDGWDDAWRHVLILASVPIASAWAAVLAGWLNATERFLTAAAAAGVRGGTAVAVGVALSPGLGLVGFAIGILAGEILAVVWLLRTTHLPFASLSGRGHSADIAPFRRLFLSMLAAALANSSRGLVDRIIASLVGPGAVSLLEYAQRLFLMPMSLLGAPMATVVLSRWASTFDHTAPAVAAGLRTAVRTMRRLPLGLGLVTTAAIWIASLSPVGQTASERFLGGDSRLVLTVLAVYAAGAAPYLLGLVTSQAILVLRDARFVTVAAVAIALANIPLNLIGLALWGLPGIAVAASILSLASWVAGELRLRAHERQAAPVPLSTPGTVS